ncbi:MAG: glycosyltransferase family 4 protein [Acidobacteria bacterium]|nr:glycosyltransferase family 4 protein [Acidobacteriota bacterium]
MILIVWTEFPPRTGGIQVHGAEFCRFLARGQHRFAVLTWEPESRRDATECREFDRAAGYGIRRLLPRNSHAEALACCRDTAREVGATAVYTSLMTLASAFGVPVTARTAGNDFLRPWCGGADEARAGAIHCRTVICNTQWTADRLAAFAPGSRRMVLTGGVDTKLFAPMDRRVDPDRVLLFIAARHVLKKGIDLAIRALAEIGDPRVELALAGTGPETLALERLARDLGVADRVDFLGMIPHELMPLYLNAADLVLFPSREAFDPGRGGVDYESMGRLPCEAAACGKAVIAADTGGVREVVVDGETGILVPPDDVAALVAAVRGLMEDPERRGRLESAARERAELLFSFDRVNRTTWEVVQSDRVIE